jgi:hypothetical protein
LNVLLKNDITFRTITNKHKGLSTHLTKALKYGRIIDENKKNKTVCVFYTGIVFFFALVRNIVLINRSMD